MFELWLIIVLVNWLVKSFFYYVCSIIIVVG